MLLCVSISAFSTIDNPGFESVTEDCETSDNPPHHPFAFAQGCVGEHWKCFSDTPDIRYVDPDVDSDEYPYGIPFEGNYYAHLHTTNNSQTGALKEGIYYENFVFECGVPYDFSLAVKAIDGDITFEVRTTDFTIPSCEENPNGSNGVQYIIQNEVVQAADGWVVITVEDFFFEEGFYLDDTIDFFILPIHVSGDNDDGHFLIDAVSFEEAPCEPMICSEKIDDTACADEGDYGYIVLECQGANSYEWDFPNGSDAFEMSCGDASVVLNAGEGTYSVTVTGAYGCTEVREYEISPSCCVCPVPSNLGCTMDKAKIKLEWDLIPNATYDITIVKNDFANCGCYGGGGPDMITVNDWPNNNFYLNPSLYPCFSWTVSANCDNGLESANSLTYCYQNGQCYSNQEFTNNNEQSENRSNITTTPMVYPNPSSRDINFEFSTPDELVLTVEVYNLNGQLVKSFPKETYPDGQYRKNWSIEGRVKGGIYLVFFKTNFGTFQEKVIIQK